jgi:farnesyl diphosphate synthase
VIDYYLHRHEAFLQKTLNNTQIPAAIIRCATEYTLFPGGKRIRPILVYLSGSLLDTHIALLDVIAASIELTHCYSLVHDDLPAMDNDDYRRGKLSCHKQYDEATAILVGDGMQALAIEVLLSGLSPLLAADQIVQVTKELVAASGASGMVSGQSLDLSELHKKNLTEQELETIHQLKTGKLILACFSMVLATQQVIAPETEHALMAYANHLGLVFQIQDDYLDYYAPKSHLGKNRCSDLANEKTTYATLFTKKQLEEKITYHYEQAVKCLTLFAEKADSFIELTQQLHSRSQLTTL